MEEIATDVMKAADECYDGMPLVYNGWATMSDKLWDISNDDDLGPGGTEIRPILRDAADVIEALQKIAERLVRIRDIEYGDDLVVRRECYDLAEDARVALSRARGDK